MIERIWSRRSLLYLPLLVLSLLYGLVSNILRLSYRCGLRNIWTAPVPVVVVGNLTVGGNGKTPVVIWLVQALQQRGFRVGIVSRGYGGKAKHYPLILGPQTTAAQAGDEPILIYQRTLAKVAVAPVRRLAVEALVSTGEIDIIITDDGLQHYALARDCEIIVVDGERRFGNGWLLPAGPMRERRSRLQSESVSAVICNGGVPHTGELAMRLVPSDAINLQSGKQRAVSELSPVVAMAGIGHPSRFFTMIRQHGARIQREVTFADHQNYSAATLNALAIDDWTNLLMTEKDAVKVRSFAAANWWYIPVNAELPVAESQALLDKISALIIC